MAEYGLQTTKFDTRLPAMYMFQPHTERGPLTKLWPVNGKQKDPKEEGSRHTRKLSENASLT